MGRRPFLVLTRQAVIPMINKITGVPATKRIRGIPSEVLLSTDDGMPADCVLNFDNLTVLRGGGVRPGGACGGGDQESAVGVAAAGRRHTAVLEADAAAGDRPAGAVVGEGETTDGRVAALEAGGGRGPAMPAVPAGQDLPGLVADQSQKGALAADGQRDLAVPLVLGGQRHVPGRPGRTAVGGDVEANRERACRTASPALNSTGRNPSREVLKVGGSRSSILAPRSDGGGTRPIRRQVWPASVVVFRPAGPRPGPEVAAAWPMTTPQPRVGLESTARWTSGGCGSRVQVAPPSPVRNRK